MTGKGVGRRVRATDIFESLIAYCPWGLLLLGIHVFLVHRCVCVCVCARVFTGMRCPVLREYGTMGEGTIWSKFLNSKKSESRW